ncbi:hypothetical protein OSSY52_19210 [Tepiditoga spiralis]|uniref:DUF1175 domain-containing protein n=1 Tax=Tepiditoga spiralis TaxID=2108365 RepID=A0A7G1G5C5_9BACT|nr:DUF1175 family protein [Tepiditoga spiralis]BBE31780.1 hypothetical protein OSSY52_19210 [Tepiditoga spiralis]
MKKSVIIIVFFIIAFLFFLFININKKNVKNVSFFNMDNNNNNYPDILELDYKDSNNFRLWYSSILIAILKKDIKLPKNYQDCAGLVRFVYKETLKKHNNDWINQSNYKGPIFNDIKKYNYPDIPYIKSKLFKIKEELKTNNFSTYASARYIIEFNMNYVSKDIIFAKNGDILAFFHPEDTDFPYHLMIYFKNTKNKYVIYHTGPINSNNKGEIRVVKINDLSLVDPTWRVNKDNKYFLGIYKFKILN